MDNKFVFFIDIDNTLLNDGVVCEKNAEAIVYARKSGHKIFINTARSMAIIPPEIKSLEVDGYVASLGCNILIDNRSIYNVTIPVNEVADLVDYFTKTGRKLNLEGDSLFITNYDCKYFSAINIKSGEELKKQYPTFKVGKVFIPCHLSDEEDTLFTEKYSYYRHPTYTEFGVKGNNKATGIKRVMNYLNIPEKNSVAIGDSVNDLEMLKAAGISVAMGDGAEKIKEMCDIVTCSAAEGGVAEGILRIING